jgi:polygalacturonase
LRPVSLHSPTHHQPQLTRLVSPAVASCTAITIQGISVPAGTTLDLTKVKANTVITFSGTTTFGYKQWAGPLISVAGTGVTVQGSGTLDGQGAKYWDGQGSNGGQSASLYLYTCLRADSRVAKPKFFYAHNMNGGSIRGITILNSPVQVFSINGATGLTVDSVTVDDSAGTAEGHNTDAFDIGSSTGVTITNSKIYNQDDCVAINSGTNIYISGLTCSGGHGLSIGSVGGRDDNTVKNVTFTNSAISNSQNGVRIKTVYGATGSVSDITYSSITLSNISNYGVVIEQDYENGSPTGTPTTGVPITGLTLKGITGTVSSSAKDYYILCGSGACCTCSAGLYRYGRLMCTQRAGRSPASPSLVGRVTRATTSRAASGAEGACADSDIRVLLCTYKLEKWNYLLVLSPLPSPPNPSTASAKAVVMPLSRHDGRIEGR